MSNTKILSAFIITLLVSGFLFISMPENAYSGVVPNPMPPCCQDDVEKSCFGGDNTFEICQSEQCMINDCQFFEDRICTSAIVNNEEIGVCAPQAQEVPAMNKWGFVALAAVLAVIGFFAVRRRIIKT